MHNIKLFIGSVEVPLKWSQFPGGEWHVTIEKSVENPFGLCSISATVTDADSIMRLLLLTNAVRELWGDMDIKLLLPYVPYGRQDRVANKGEALSIKVFCDLINAQNYEEVTIFDPHSDVTPALLDRCYVVGQERFVHMLPLSIRENAILVSPDFGASKKTQKVAQSCGFERILQATKVRDTKTGKITNTEIIDVNLFVGKDALIVDDICDGGRTFIELSKALKQSEIGKLYLYVTHGIFSKGMDELKDHFDHIYTAHSFHEPSSDFLTILDLQGARL